MDAAARRDKERQAYRVHRRGPRLAHRRGNLAPLGYDVTISDRPKAGGMMRTQIPKSPAENHHEEVDYILDLA